MSSKFTKNEATLDNAVISSRLLSLTEEFDEVDKDRTLYSGITVADVQKLGKFPDYAKLSEVPLPEPLADFDIDLAQGRPYRPLRWPYHQTMGINLSSNIE